jgi:hypothetical protein
MIADERLCQILKRLIHFRIFNKDFKVVKFKKRIKFKLKDGKRPEAIFVCSGLRDLQADR